MCIEGGKGNEEGLWNRVGFTKCYRQVLSIKKKKKKEPKSENLCPGTKIQGQPPLRKLVRKGPGFGDKTKTQLSKLG